jgi:hypothetical protein
MFGEGIDPPIALAVWSRSEGDVSNLVKALERFRNTHGRFTKRRIGRLDQARIGVEVPLVVCIVEQSGREDVCCLGQRAQDLVRPELRLDGADTGHQATSPNSPP